MPYNRNKSSAASQPSVDPKVIDRRRDEGLKAYQEKVRDLDKRVRELDAQKTALEATLQESYKAHQSKIDAFYEDLKSKRIEFEAYCHTQELKLIERQRRIDEQQANLETQRVTVSDARMDLIEKENQLIAFGNELNAQQQIIDNDKDYVQSMEESNRVERVELDLFKEEMNATVKRIQERKEQILKMEADLSARIKEHDTRLDQIQLEEEKFQKIISQYKEAQAALTISQAERREIDQAVQDNKDYAAKLKEWNDQLTDKENKLAVRQQALNVLGRDLKQRQEQLRVVEKRYGGSNGK